MSKNNTRNLNNDERIAAYLTTVTKLIEEAQGSILDCSGVMNEYFNETDNTTPHNIVFDVFCSLEKKINSVIDGPYENLKKSIDAYIAENAALKAAFAAIDTEINTQVDEVEKTISQDLQLT